MKREKSRDSFSDIQVEPVDSPQERATNKNFTAALSEVLTQTQIKNAPIPEPIVGQESDSDDESAQLLPKKFKAGGQMRSPSSNQSLPGAAEPDVIDIKNPEAIRKFKNKILEEVMWNHRLANPLLKNKGKMSLGFLVVSAYSGFLSVKYGLSLVPFANEGASTLSYLKGADALAKIATLFFNLPLTAFFVNGSFDDRRLENTIFNLINEALDEVGHPAVPATEKNIKQVVSAVFALIAGYSFAAVGGKNLLDDLIDWLTMAHISDGGAKMVTNKLGKWFSKLFAIPLAEVWRCVKETQPCYDIENPDMPTSTFHLDVNLAKTALTVGRAEKYSHFLESMPYLAKGIISDQDKLFELMVAGTVEGAPLLEAFPRWTRSQINSNIETGLFLSAVGSVIYGLIGLMFKAETFTYNNTDYRILSVIVAIVSYAVLATTIAMSVDGNVNVIKKDVETAAHRFRHPARYSPAEHTGGLAMTGVQGGSLYFSFYTAATVDSYNVQTRQYLRKYAKAIAGPAIAVNKAVAVVVSALFNYTGFLKLLRQFVTLMVLGKNHWGEQVKFSISDRTDSQTKLISYSDALFNAQALVETIKQGAHLPEIQEMTQQLETDYGNRMTA